MTWRWHWDGKWFNNAVEKFNLPSVEGGDEFENPATSSGPQQSEQQPDESQNWMPASTIKAHKELIADQFNNVTIMFIDQDVYIPKHITLSEVVYFPKIFKDDQEK